MQLSSAKRSASPSRHSLATNRRQLQEATEAVKGSLAAREQVAHHVLNAAGKQRRDPLGVVQRLAHEPHETVRIAVIAATVGDLLQLVYEDDQMLVVSRGDALRKLECYSQRPRRILSAVAGADGQLDGVTEVGLGLHCEGQRSALGDRGAGLTDFLDQLVHRPAVGQRLLCDRLRKRRGIRVLEEADRNRVEALRAEYADRGLAHAALTRAPGSGDNAMRAAG